MIRRSSRLIAASIAALGLASSTGCFVAADLLNPAAIATFGFDPATIQSPVGTVIVVFVNDTDQPAIFHAFQQDDPDDDTTASTFEVQVDPNSNENEVLSCPTGLVSLGSPVLPAGGPDAAHVGATVVAFTGDPVLESRDYLCGDVIEYRVSVIAGGDPTSDFVITARVRPGR